MSSSSSLPPLPPRSSRKDVNSKKKQPAPRSKAGILMIWFCIIILIGATGTLGYYIHQMKSNKTVAGAATPTKTSTGTQQDPGGSGSTSPQGTNSGGNSGTTGTDNGTGAGTGSPSTGTDNGDSSGGHSAASTASDMNPFAMVLLGMDTHGSIKTDNSDVMMVVAVNPAKKSAAVVSIPRDTRINRTGLSPIKANAIYSHYRHQDLSSALSSTEKQLSSYLDVPIQSGAVIAFQGLVDVVDQLGGITINVDQTMCYNDHEDGTSINLNPGKQKLSGKQALDYVRYIRSSCEKAKGSNDFQRNVRQQQVAAAILKKMISLQGVRHISSIWKSVQSNIKTDASTAELLKMAGTYSDINQKDVHYVPITGKWKSPYVYAYQDSLGRAKKALQEVLQE